MISIDDITVYLSELTRISLRLVPHDVIKKREPVSVSTHWLSGYELRVDGEFIHLNLCTVFGLSVWLTDYIGKQTANDCNLVSSLTKFG
jgi:hypothetical protein